MGVGSKLFNVFARFVSVTELLFKGLFLCALSGKIKELSVRKSVLSPKTADRYLRYLGTASEFNCFLITY